MLAFIAREMGRRTERVADALAPGAQKEAAEGAPPAEGEVKQVEKVKEARGVAPAKKAKKPQGGRGTDSEDKGGGAGPRGSRKEKGNAAAGKPEWTTMMGLGGRRREDMPNKRVVAVLGPSEEEERRQRQRALERRRKEEYWQQVAERTVQEKIDEEERKARERLERCKKEAKVRSERRQKIKEKMKKFVPTPETSAQRRADVPLHLKYMLEYEQRALQEEEQKLREYREGVGKARNMGLKEILSTHMGAENRREREAREASPRGGVWARGSGDSSHSQGPRGSASGLSLPDIHRKGERGALGEAPSSPAWRSPKSSRFSLQPVSSNRTPRALAGGAPSALPGRSRAGVGGRADLSDASSGHHAGSSGAGLSGGESYDSEPSSHQTKAPSPSGSQYSVSASAADGGTPRPPVRLEALDVRQSSSLSEKNGPNNAETAYYPHCVDRATSPGTPPWARDRATSPILFDDTAPGSLTKLLNAKKNGRGTCVGDTNDNVNFGTLMLSNSVEAPSETFLEISTISGPRVPESSTELPTLNGTSETVDSLEKTNEGLGPGSAGEGKALMEEEEAATLIQARVRGHQARRALKPTEFQLDNGL